MNIDTLKLLLEGSDDLTTDIKYAKKVSIRGRPVMMATNETIWTNMSTAMDPIKKRCEWVHMTRAWQKPCYFMATKDKDILQYVLNRLYKELFPTGYNDYKTQSDFNMAVEELDDETLANMPMLDLDQFVTEMN